MSSPATARRRLTMTEDNVHANSVNVQLRQAKEDDDLPDWLAEKHDLDEDDEREDGEDDE